MYHLLFRKKIVVNTDPQRRCYDGCHFSSVKVWTDWQPVAPYRTLEDAQSAAATFKQINPERQYKIEPGRA